MKNANRTANNETETESRQDIIKFSKRLELIIAKIKVEKKEFAKAGGVTAPTLSGYLTAKREPSATVLAKWVLVFNIDANWLLTGQGEMFRGQDAQPHPSEPMPEKERVMRSYFEMMKQINATDEDIKKGLNAYMGVSEDKEKRSYGSSKSSSSSGPLRVHESTDDFGETDI